MKAYFDLIIESRQSTVKKENRTYAVMGISDVILIIC